MAEEKKQSAEQISETLVNAMGMIAENAVQGLSFDKTEVAEIVDITNRENGDYVVFNGSARYHAYTENTSYTLGTKVYVNIPNNDMSGEKTIIRKYNLKDSNRGLNYISPWDRFTPASPDLLTDDKVSTRTFNNYDNGEGIGLLANYNKAEHTEFPEAQAIELFKVTSMDLYQIEPNYQNYKYMGLSADFRTILSSFGTTVGNYGLKLVCNFKRYREGNQDGMITETHTYVLDTKNMVGSIYNFFADFEQQAVFELPNPEEHWMITDLTGYFFQEGNFWMASAPVPATRAGLNNIEELLEDNIFVKNIKIRFGHDKADTYETDVVKIYTLNGETYDATQKNESLNERRVYLNWLHRNPETAMDDDPYGVLEEIKSVNNIPNDTNMKFKANIWWLRTSIHTLDEYRAEQDSSNATTSQLITLQTEYLSDASNLTSSEMADKWFKGDTNPNMRQLIDGFGLKINKDYTYNDSGSYQLTNSGISKIQKSISQNDYNAGTLDRSSEWGEGWIPTQLALDEFYTDFAPDVTRQYTTIRCIIEYGPWTVDDDGNSVINKESQYYTVLYSNELQFRNLSWVADLATWDMAIGLNITIKDKSNGHYPVYNGTDGSLLNPHDSTIDRLLEADISSSYSGKSYLNGQESLIWKVPKINSMISIRDAEFPVMGGQLLQGDDPIFDVDNYGTIIGAFDGENFDYIMYSANNSDSIYQRYRYDYQVQINQYRDELRDKIIRFNYDKYKLVDQNNTSYQDYVNSALNEITNNFTEENLVLETVTITNENNNEVEVSAATGYKIGTATTAFKDNNFAISIYNIYNKIVNTKEKEQSVPDIHTVYNRLTYRIAPSYNKAKTNNTISCFLIKNNSMVKADVTMTFGQHGTAGTDYTFAIYFGELFDKNWNKIGLQEPVITVGQKGKNAEGNDVVGYREILFNLYDANNEVVDLTSEQKHDIINKWVSADSNGFFWGANSFWDNFSQITVDEGTSTKHCYTRIAIRTADEKGKGINDCKGYVLQATYASSRATSTYNDKQYTLYGVNFTQLFPIIVRTDTRYSMDASGFIYYSESGGSPRYLNDIILLRDKGIAIDRKVKIRQGYTNDNKLITDRKIITWNPAEIANIPKNNNRDKNGFPALNAEYRLVPYPIYLKGINNTPLVLEGCIGDNQVYVIPLVILQNKYQVPILNSWNGNLLIDEDNNRVMAATIAAGHKDNQNRFSGVIMGDVGSTDNINQERITTTTGLYGYHEGAQSFGFLENGTGFIGKSGTGRIYFDGTSGTIQSGNYNASGGTDGTKIDLDDGSIDMWGKGQTWIYDPEISKYKIISTDNTDNTHIHLDTLGTSSKPYFLIEVPKYTTENNNGTVTATQTIERQSLFRIDKSNFYLQTADYQVQQKDSSGNITQQGMGLKLNLKTGSLNSYNKININGALGSEIRFGDDNQSLRLGINTSGKAYLTSTGQINITGGTGSSIKFGSVGDEGNYRFKVDGSNGKVTLSSLDFVKFDSGVIESGDASELDEDGNKVTLYAKDIKPQWMTFVTDISGVVHKSPVKITIKITDDVEVPYTIDEPYTYPTTDTQWVQGVTRTLYTLDEWHYSTTGFSIESGPALPFGPEGGDSSYKTTVVMDGYTKVTGTGVGHSKVYKKVSVPYTYNGEGSSTYDFVDSVILTVTKISMWALTNDSASPKKVTIS